MQRKQPRDYVALAEWHRASGSLPYYWQDLQEQAAHENAPLDAIYRDHDRGVWRCVSDLAPDHWFRILLTMKGKA